MTVVALTLCLMGLGLFFGGMLSAAREIRAEKAAGVPVTRPGWRKADRDPKSRGDYNLPRGTGFVVWPLVAVGRPDLGARYLARREARRVPR